MGSLITGIIFISAVVLLVVALASLEGELRAGERDGIINRGYVGEDDENKDDV